MSKKVIFKSYECDCLLINDEIESLEELKAQAKTGELEVRCKNHGKYMYPKSYHEDAEVQ